ncbi:MAG: (2Fe-2S)-binding protein, partial [Anaerolineales bacterium]
KALLGVPLTEVSSYAPYRFCPSPGCPTVYYRGDGMQVFGEQELRERVYQKHTDDPSILICYCFGYRVADVLAEWEREGVTTVIERIQAGIQAGQCACDIRNPQGRCCLGNVRELVDRLAAPAPDKDTHNG